MPTTHTRSGPMRSEGRRTKECATQKGNDEEATRGDKAALSSPSLLKEASAAMAPVRSTTAGVGILWMDGFEKDVLLEIVKRGTLITCVLRFCCMMPSFFFLPCYLV